MATKGHKQRMAEIDAERQRMLEMWDKSHEDYDKRITGNEAWRQQQADQAAYEQVANRGWLDESAKGAGIGASMGSAWGPVGTGIGAIAGGLIGGVKGGVESGIAGEKAGIKDPWLNALSPINLDPTSGPMSGGAGTVNAMGGTSATIAEAMRQQRFDEATGRGAEEGGPTTELMDYSSDADRFTFDQEEERRRLEEEERARLGGRY